MNPFDIRHKELLRNRPKVIKAGTRVRCNSIRAANLTVGREYTVLGHHCYLVTYGCKGGKYQEWEQFFTLKNDSGWTIKVNKDKFTIINQTNEQRSN